MNLHSLERNLDLHLQELQQEAYRHALLRKAGPGAAARAARWLRALADRFDGPHPDGHDGPWREDFRRFVRA